MAFDPQKTVSDILDKKAFQESRLPNARTVLTTKDGGRVVDIQGKFYFVSPGYSTGDPEKVSEIIRQAQEEGGTTPRQMIESEFRKEMVTEAPISAGVLKASQGVPFIGEYIPELIGTVSPDTRRQVESMQRAMEEEYPLASTGLRVAGAVGPSLLAPAGLFQTTGGALAQTIRGAGMAGTEGFVSGVGAAEGDITDRLSSGVKQGVLSAILGGSFSGIASALTSGVTSTKAQSKAINELAEKLGISKEAATIIGIELRGGSSVEDAITAIRRAGAQGMVADAGVAEARLLDAVMAAGGEARRIGQEAVEGRVSEQSAALSTVMDRAFGEAPTGMRTVAEEAAQRTSAARGQAYQRAYSSPINYASALGQELESIIKRVDPEDLKAAQREAEKLMRAEGIGSPQFKIIIGDEGAEIIKQPNVIELDYLKRGLQNLAYGKYSDGFGGVQGYGVTLNKLASDLRTTLGKLVPEYDKAVRLGGDKIREIQAGQMGNVIFSPKTTVEDVMMAVRGASKTEIDAIRLGARNQIQEIMSNAKNFIASGGDENITAARNMLRDLGTTASKNKIRLILGQDGYRAFQKQFDELRAAFELRASTSVNSKTAERLGIQQRIEDVVAPGAVESLMRGDPVDFSKKLIRLVTGRTDEALAQEKDEVLAEVATVLTGIKGRDAEVALQYIREAMRDVPLSQAKANYINSVLQRIIVPGSTGVTPAIQGQEKAK